MTFHIVGIITPTDELHYFSEEFKPPTRYIYIYVYIQLYTIIYVYMVWLTVKTLECGVFFISGWDSWGSGEPPSKPSRHGRSCNELQNYN